MRVAGSALSTAPGKGMDYKCTSHVHIVIVTAVLNPTENCPQVLTVLTVLVGAYLPGCAGHRHNLWM
jgi:hypothetical protein